MKQKIKLLLLDADGVCISNALKFSENLAKDYRVTTETTDEFFKHDFNDCLTGRKDLKKCLPPYLLKWGLKHSIEELLQYWFESENHPDHELLNEVANYRRQGIVCCLATNQERYRTEYIVEIMNYQSFFDRIYSSCNLGVKKPDPQFLQKILNDFPKINKSEVLLWDNSQRNIEAARQFGINAELYIGFADFKQKMQESYYL